MATIANLVVNLTAQTADLQRSVEQGNATLDRLQSTVTRVTGAIAAMASARAVVTWGQEMVQAFSEQENALVGLTTALQAQGQATPVVIQQYEALAGHFQRTTVFGDELILKMQALLVQIGGVMPEQMAGALKASTDLASGLGIDLATATQLVGKAFAGETGTLKRYGIVIDETALKTRGADAVLEAISERFGGQAQAAASTFTGQMAILSNQIGDFKEVVGATIVSVVLPLANAFMSLPEPIQTVVVAAGVLATALAPLGIAAGGMALAFGTTIPAAFAAVLPFLGPAGLIAAGVIAVVAVWKNWDAIVDVARSVYTGVKEWLVDRFTAVIDSVKSKVDAVTGFFRNLYDAVVGHSYVPDMVDQIGSEFAKLETVMVSPALEANQRVVEGFSAMAQQVSDTVVEIGNVPAVPNLGGGSGLKVPPAIKIEDLAAYGKSITSVQHGGTQPIGAFQFLSGGSYVPPMAMGGPVSSGRPYLVGERGPELFVPQSSGRIVPNGATSGGITVHVSVDARESMYDTPAGVARMADKVGQALAAQLRAQGVGL